MKASISIDEKKDFIRWLLNHYQMKMREAMWVLNYVSGHDQIIQYVHFVDDLSGVSRGLILAAEGSSGEPFRFFKGNLATSDPEKAFHDIRLNWNEDLYIQLDFENAMNSPEYALVRTDNPHLGLQLNDEEKELAKKFLDQTSLFFSKKNVLEKIDQALDEKDRDAFFKLVRIYHSLTNKK
ncbi:ReoY family proteolytic degradation factor [Listeria sp. PSOL-1]|uniref:ReoY family proteolytic degradation factor n=1 Tax=Listeria sp. PSOL-1 TaxID=1844999 RepID=UPI0013D01244|nr:ReoY family proteolytic degradation factor [Listeria sp. PSOL-1]